MKYESEIIDIIKMITPLKEKVTKIGLTSKLSDIGIDSILYVRILVELENSLGITFPDTYLSINPSYTIMDLCKAVNNIMASEGQENE